METRRKHLRDLTIEESLEILEKYVSKQEKSLLQFKNHMKYSREKIKNTFRFTTVVMSVDFLSDLLADTQVKNVYYNAAVPPPGGSTDGTSLRYKIYIQYFQKEENLNEVS